MTPLDKLMVRHHKDKENGLIAKGYFINPFSPEITYQKFIQYMVEFEEACDLAYEKGPIEVSELDK